MAAVAVLEGEADLLARSEQLEAAGVSLVAKAQKGARRDPVRLEVASQDGDRGDADAAANEDRPGSPWVDVGRIGEGAAERSASARGRAFALNQPSICKTLG